MWLKAAWGLLSFVVIQEGFEPPTHGLEVLLKVKIIWTDKIKESHNRADFKGFEAVIVCWFFSVFSLNYHVFLQIRCR